MGGAALSSAAPSTSFNAHVQVAVMIQGTMVRGGEASCVLLLKQAEIWPTCFGTPASWVS